MNATVRTAAFIALGCFGLAAGAKPQVDPESGFIIDKNWEIVKATCTACHSSKLVIGQRGSRDTWKGIIRWMQATQGLWQFDPETEKNILDYLATNYPPGEAYRRKPLSPLLMPDNPYAVAAQ